MSEGYVQARGYFSVQENQADSEELAKTKSKGGVSKDKEMDDSFKENPFTFLAADDSILRSCV
jgi:hypothetical protein